MKEIQDEKKGEKQGKNEDDIGAFWLFLFLLPCHSVFHESLRKNKLFVNSCQIMLKVRAIRLGSKIKKALTFPKKERYYLCV